ncbi:hypothetical protein Tsubulata_013663 [Turnera subulata]|uniref:Uncharacterized protein n=1 Tax=Turnera subulata TaxID=218843 RepID=A0A9Q0J9L1_9ROSI|nr:hypothetical protein Tsubulata_013663 [Turnera subulata]
MRDLQNPKKPHSRFTAPADSSSSKDSYTLKKKSLKIGRNGAAPSIRRRLSADSPEESADFSPVKEIVAADSEMADFSPFRFPCSPPISALAPADDSYHPDLTPTGNTTSVTNDSVGVLAEQVGSDDESGGSHLGLAEADILKNFLESIRTRYANSSARDHQQKECLDAFVKAVIDEYHGLPDDRDRGIDLLWIRQLVLFLCCFLLILAFSVRFFFNYEFHDSYSGPPPS